MLRGGPKMSIKGDYLKVLDYDKVISIDLNSIESFTATQDYDNYWLVLVKSQDRHYLETDYLNKGPLQFSTQEAAQSYIDDVLEGFALFRKIKLDKSLNL